MATLGVPAEMRDAAGSCMTQSAPLDGHLAKGEAIREGVAVSDAREMRITGNGEGGPIDAYHHRRYPFAKFSPRPDAWPRSA